MNKEELREKIDFIIEEWHFGAKIDGSLRNQLLNLFDQYAEVIRKEERIAIKKAINEYYARPEVEQGIIGFREAVRQALKEEE